MTVVATSKTYNSVLWVYNSVSARLGGIDDPTIQLRIRTRPETEMSKRLRHRRYKSFWLNITICRSFKEAWLLQVFRSLKGGAKVSGLVQSTISETVLLEYEISGRLT